MKKNKRIFILVLLLILGNFFMGAQPAQAAIPIVGELFNVADMQLNSLDWVEDSILKLLILLVLLVVESTTFVVISAGLLDWASSLQSGLGQTLVTTGWGFTSGLANMFFILIFIVIAFSYFFKEDTWHMQKALPRLIAVALLINFSLLLVGMVVDTGWIVQNSFRNVFFEEKGLTSVAIQPLIDSSKDVLKIAAAIPLGYLVKAIIPLPFISVGGLAAIGFLALTGDSIFGTISQTILLIIFNFASGLVFLAYAILFLVRIGFIWLLAITAPLAFMAFILPQTEKYFRQWLDALFKWTFLGVIVFFLMGLGLKLFSAFSTGSKLSVPSGFGSWDFPQVYYKYIFLLVYLVVALTAVKKFIPAGTEAVWSLGDMVRDRGVKFAAEQTRKYGLRAQAAGLEAAAGAKRRIDTGVALSWRERIASPFLRQVRPELAEAQAMAVRRGLIKEQRNGLLAKTKDMDEEGTKAVLRAELEKYKGAPLKDRSKSIALAELLIEKNAQRDADKDFVEKAWKDSGPDDITKNHLKRVALTKMLHWAKPQEMTDLIGKMNSGDIDKLDDAAKANAEVIKQIIGTMRSDLIGRLGSQNQIVFQKVQSEIETTLGDKWKTAPDTLNKKELGVLRSLHLSAAVTNLNWETYGSLQEIEDRIKNWGKPSQPPPPPKTPPIWTPGTP